MSNGFDPDQEVLSILIWVQTVSNSYQRRRKSPTAWKELNYPLILKGRLLSPNCMTGRRSRTEFSDELILVVPCLAKKENCANHFFRILQYLRLKTV